MTNRNYGKPRKPDVNGWNEPSPSHSPSAYSPFAHPGLTAISESDPQPNPDSQTSPLNLECPESTFYRPAFSNPSAQPSSLADRVFGRQLQQGSFELRLSAATASRRAEVHEAQMEEMDELHNEVFNQLNFARRPYRLTTPQQIGQLQRMMHQLESDRRREELAYWKDMAEIRQQSLEQAFEYRATRDRYGLLGGSGANA